jgi:polyribonucleotide nucleotidyltransferase
LGTTRDEQRVDGLFDDYGKRFMLDYNFPSYSVGECRPIRGPGRREIGHGALAERSVKPVLPSSENFPYTMRVISDITESNGCSSMATVCAATLSLMDAGVPISQPVAGISIGLVKEGDEYVILTDIIGNEDHFGDMDFKIAGTKNGITGFQLDLKINGLPFDIVKASVAQSREARMQILENMATALAAPREEVAATAPRITTVQINPEKIGALIGPGGKNIRRIVEITGAQVDINDDNSGRVNVYATSEEAMKRALNEIDLVCGEIEEGKIYRGIVKATKEFGCFVEVLPGQEGLVHISELADFRVRKTEDVCKPGDEMVVKCLGVDERGRVRLSRKAALEELEARRAAKEKAEGGEEEPAAEAPETAEEPAEEEKTEA